MNDIYDARVRATFGPEKYQRLVDLKRRWDPTNLFAMNQNISPGPHPVRGGGSRSQDQTAVEEM
jgi:hypothetical protein